jgi:hypothetical protein
VSLTQKASLHFCQECNNLLYPKADAQRRIIVYACRICQYSEIVENQLVYRNDLLTVTKCASVPVLSHFLTVHEENKLGSRPTLAQMLHWYTSWLADMVNEA